ncbi:ABC transporter permease [Microbacterium sp. EYE_5]|uniref:ABC transporter permease n=1 Tax=unclassified Microbacterium TaxID=2609290 RepID=UPI002004FEB1|nr:MULTISPECIES: ABC transporter permease [unclassified Microbacterium]MCK6079329.1 ABC transporter permease [Microbacterium sp. EYE_382]MCK6084599.1 ABC transporter permease [Microbacterium sp. EYE_384]MCK6123172.1 ABC transporter permease [Microbacterium sp. EYE_80]MCK6125363.1 ABC transporter permease [Microbacterium sp. EYE_79]MCK6140283.1 ABC transporter permease [Microbacterium sp. EYE_39]
MTAVVDAPRTRSPLARLSAVPTSAWVFLAFIALFVIGGAIRPSLFTIEGFISTATFAAILAIASFGQTLAVIQGGIDLSVPNTIAFSALAFLTWNAALGPVGAFIAALLAGTVIGFVNGVVVARIGLTPIVTTIAMNGLLFGLVLLNFSLAELTVVPDFVTAITSAKITVLGVSFAAVLPLAVGLMIVLQLVLSTTGWGRSLYLVGSSEDTARLAGQPVAWIRIRGYMASGALAAFAGIVIVGYYQQAEAMMGSPYLLASVAAVVVGGASIFGGSGSVVGTFAGALVLGQVSTLVVVFNLGSSVQDIVYGAIILLVVAIYGRARRA